MRSWTSKPFNGPETSTLQRFYCLSIYVLKIKHLRQANTGLTGMFSNLNSYSNWLNTDWKLVKLRSHFIMHFFKGYLLTTILIPSSLNPLSHKVEHCRRRNISSLPGDFWQYTTKSKGSSELTVGHSKGRLSSQAWALHSLRSRPCIPSRRSGSACPLLPRSWMPSTQDSLNTGAFAYMRA